jgi:tripeptidyl-peptidase-1
MAHSVKYRTILMVFNRILCNAYLQLGARGTSMLFASGDGGVSGGTYPAEQNCTKFISTFPAGCP